MEDSKKKLEHHLTNFPGIDSKNATMYWEAVYFLGTETEGGWGGSASNDSHEELELSSSPLWHFQALTVLGEQKAVKGLITKRELHTPDSCNISRQCLAMCSANGFLTSSS